MDKNRELAELLGLCWHEWDNPVLHGQMYQCVLCGIVADIPWHPDYTSDAGKVQLLREMEKREDWLSFLNKVGLGGSYRRRFSIYIEYILDTTGKLRYAVIEWLKKEAADE